MTDSEERIEDMTLKILRGRHPDVTWIIEKR